MRNELNPNHPATVAAHGQWHKIVALIMMQREQNRVVISVDELNRFADVKSGWVVTIKFDDNVGIILELIDGAEAERLARQEGGLPV